jgi:hypothetical protein
LFGAYANGFKICGYRLREIGATSHAGKPVSEIHDAKPGDLALKVKMIRSIM